MIKILLYWIFISLFILSCSPNRQNTGRIILEMNPVDSLDLASVLSAQSVVSLDDSILVGQVHRVKSDGNSMLLWAGGLFRFISDGHFINQISRKGRGPGEYTMITSVDFSDRIVVVIDQYRRILLFQEDGTFLREKEIPFFAVSCIIRGNRLLLASAYQDRTDKFHWFSLSDLEELSSFGPINESELTYSHFMDQHNFYIDESGALLFHEPMNDGVYRIEEDGYPILYSFDFWGKTAPSSFWSEKYDSAVDVVQSVQEKGYVYGLSYFAAGGKSFVYTYSDDSGFKTGCYNKRRAVG